jgi:hypothetical protein
MASWHNLGFNRDKKLICQSNHLSTISRYLERFNLSPLDLNVESWLENENDDGPGYSILTDNEIVEEVQRLNNHEVEANKCDDGEEALASALNNSDASFIEWVEKNINFQEPSNDKSDDIQKSVEETLCSNSEVIQSCESLIKWVEKKIDSQQDSKNIKEHLLNLIEIAKSKNVDC